MEGRVPPVIHRVQAIQPTFEEELDLFSQRQSAGVHDAVSAVGVRQLNVRTVLNQASKDRHPLVLGPHVAGHHEGPKLAHPGCLIGVAAFLEQVLDLADVLELDSLDQKRVRCEGEGGGHRQIHSR